jgi:hypothetical protein
MFERYIPSPAANANQQGPAVQDLALNLDFFKGLQ